jgi:hypothetical protein
VGVEGINRTQANGFDGTKLYHPGPKVRVDREAVRRSLESKPDLYLHELQAELRATTALR